MIDWQQLLINIGSGYDKKIYGVYEGHPVTFLKFCILIHNYIMTENSKFYFIGTL